MAHRSTSRSTAQKEYLYDTIVNRFNDAFTDTMVMQRAKHDLKSLHMVKDELDQYVMKFESLAQQANYNLTKDSVIEMFLNGLHQGLAQSIITHTNPLPQNWEEWVQAAQIAQQKFLYLKSCFSKDDQKGDSANWKNKKCTPQQWKQAFSCQNLNAMNTTSGRVRACASITDEERMCLLTEGHCFRCKQKGHMSHACP